MEYKKNDRVTLTIEDMGSDGEGIGKVDGFTLFIKDAVIGDQVEAKIIKSKKHYAYARLEKVLQPSPFRVEPKCAYHRQCGGCQLQAISYSEQLHFKEQKIRNNLIRIGGFDAEYIDERMQPIVGMEEPFHYRNKAQYPIGTDRDGNVITGFYAGRTHTIIANTDCALGASENQQILETILSYMRKNKVTAYDEVTGKGLVRHVLIRKGFTSGQLMVCLVINKKMTKMSYPIAGVQKNTNEFLPNQGELLAALAKIQGMTSVSVSINAEKTNVIMGTMIHNLWGESTIEDTIHVRDMQKENYPYTGDALTFKISPLSFYQVNPVQTEKLYSLALEYAGLTGKEKVIDAYCGTGTIGLIAASQAKEVIGVELNRDAVKDAVINAKRNNIKNEQFYNADAGKFMVELSEQNKKVDVVFMDPPRAGSDEAFLSSVVKLAPKKVVYVSCNPETLARDLKYLTRHGYQAVECQPCDMFPFTKHVEAICLLSKKF